MDSQREHGQGMEKKYIYIHISSGKGGISEKSRNKNHLFEHIFLVREPLPLPCVVKKMDSKRKKRKNHAANAFTLAIWRSVNSVSCIDRSHRRFRKHRPRFYSYLCGLRSLSPRFILLWRGENRLLRFHGRHTREVHTCTHGQRHVQMRPRIHAKRVFER